MHNSAVDFITVLIAWRPEPADRWPLLRPESRWRLTSRAENRSSLLTPGGFCMLPRRWGILWQRWQFAPQFHTHNITALPAEQVPLGCREARWRALWESDDVWTKMSRIWGTRVGGAQKRFYLWTQHRPTWSFYLLYTVGGLHIEKDAFLLSREAKTSQSFYLEDEGGGAWWEESGEKKKGTNVIWFCLKSHSQHIRHRVQL